MSKRVKRKEGQILLIKLPDERYTLGLVLKQSIAFFDYICDQEPANDLDIESLEITFVIWVEDRAVTSNRWEVISSMDVPLPLREPIIYFKKDSISGKLTLYNEATCEEFDATKEDCENFECAAVWSPEHVEDRLHSHFYGLPNMWVESMHP
ncbi:MAG: Imm26 family immunity protein [Akkermansiaceae bacterium]